MFTKMSTKNKDFLLWLRCIPAADRRDRLQELLCARAINRTSARAALDKLQLNPVVVLQRLDGVVGMMNAAKFRSAEIVKSDNSEGMDVVSETDSCLEDISDCENELPAQSTSSTKGNYTCDNESSALAASSAEELSVCDNEASAQVTPLTEQTYARDSASSSHPPRSTDVGRKNKNDTVALQAVKEDAMISVRPSSQSENLKKTNDQLNGIDLANMPSVANGINKPTPIAKRSMKTLPVSIESKENACNTDQPGVSVSQIANLIIEKHLAVNETESHLLNNASDQPPVVPDNAENSKESNTSCVTRDAEKEGYNTTNSSVDTCLSDVAQCVYNTELLLLRLNKTIKESAKLPETDRYPANLRALLESSSQLKEQNKIVQRALDKGVSRRLGRQFYPKLLQEINTKTPYTLYSSMRLATMLSMIQNLEDKSRDPKFIYNSFVAATLQNPGESRQERTADSVRKTTSAVSSVTSQQPTRTHVKDSKIPAGQKVRVKTFNTASQTPVHLKSSASSFGASNGLTNAASSQTSSSRNSSTSALSRRSPSALATSSAKREQPPTSSVDLSENFPAHISPNVPHYLQPLNENRLASAAPNTSSPSLYSLDTTSPQNRVTQGNTPVQASGTQHKETILTSNTPSSVTARTTLRDLLSQSQPMPSNEYQGFASSHSVQLNRNQTSFQSQQAPSTGNQTLSTLSRANPSIGNQRPAQTHMMLSNGNQSFAQSHSALLNGNMRLGQSQVMPLSGNQSLALSQQMPSAGNQSLPLSQQIPSAGNQRLPQSQQMPSAGNQGLLQSQQMPSSRNQRLSQSHQMPLAGNQRFPQTQQMPLTENQSLVQSQLAAFIGNRRLSQSQTAPSGNQSLLHKQPMSHSGPPNVTISQSHMQQYQLPMSSVMSRSISQNQQSTTTRYQHTGTANFAPAPQNSLNVQSEQIVRTTYTVQQSQNSVSNVQAYNQVPTYIPQETNYQSAYRASYPQQSGVAVVLPQMRPSIQHMPASASRGINYENAAPFNSGNMNTQQNSFTGQPFFQQPPVTLTQPVITENCVTQVTNNPKWIGGYSELQSKSQTRVGATKVQEPSSVLPTTTVAVMTELPVTKQTFPAMHVPQFEKAVVSSAVQHHSVYFNQHLNQHTASVCSSAPVTSGTQSVTETAQRFGQRYYGPGSDRPVPSAAALKVYGSVEASQLKPVGYVNPEIPRQSTEANVPPSLNTTLVRPSIAAVNKDVPVAKVVMQVSPDTRACSRDSGIFTPEPGQEVDSNERFEDEIFGADDHVKIELMRVRGERTMKLVGIERISDNIGIDRPSVITTVSRYFSSGSSGTMHLRQ